MLKLISKTNCERCSKIKDFLNTNKINYQEIQAKETDIDVYRKMLIDNNKPLGFPILLQGSEIINGQAEEITNWITGQYLRTPNSLYFWAH